MGMTIPQSKPLLINLNVNNKTYDLPTTASAVGIDLNTGKQLYYSTSSFDWATLETITASYGIFSQNLTASNGIAVTGGTLSSSGNISTAGNLYVQGTTQLTGAAYLSSSFSASGNISTAGSLYVQGTSFHTGAAYFGNVVSASSGFQAGASSTFKAMIVSGAINAAQTISASENISTAGNLFIQGNSQHTGSAYFGGAVGQTIINTNDTTQPILYVSGTDTRGGAGYFNFLKTSNNYSTGTNRDKYFRLDSAGAIQVINNAYSATLFELTDTGNLKIPAGSSYFGPVKELFATKTGATGVVTHDCVTGSVFYHTSPSNNWTANLTNLNLSASYATTVTMVISEGVTAYLPTAVQIEGSAQTLNWQGNVTPTGTPSRVNIVTFSILNNAGTYTVLGQIVSF